MENVLNTVLETRGEIVAAIATAIVIAGGVLAKKFNLFGGGYKGDAGVAIEAVSKQVAALDVRINRVEVDLEHLPTRVEFHQMSIQLAQLDGKINGVEASVRATGHAVGVIQEHMLNWARKK